MKKGHPQLPVLRTERLKLRAFTDEDVNNIFRTYAESSVTKYYDLETLAEEKDAIPITKVFKERFERGIGIRWAIELKSTGEYIGDCGFNPWDAFAAGV